MGDEKFLAMEKKYDGGCSKKSVFDIWRIGRKLIRWEEEKKKGRFLGGFLGPSTKGKEKGGKEHSRI